MVDTNVYWKREVKERKEESAIAIEDTKFLAENKKAILVLEIELLYLALKTVEKKKTYSRVEQMQLRKEINVLLKEWKQKQKTAFLYELQIDQEMEQKIEEIKKSAKIQIEVL